MRLAPPLAAILLLLLAGCRQAPPPPIPFAPYGAAYAEKPDFARLELDHPLAAADRAKITPESLRSLPQEKIDQIYARLTAGPLPDGPYDEDFFFADGGGARRLAEVLGGARGFAVSLKLTQLDALGNLLMKGKVFSRQKGELRTAVARPDAVARLLGVDAKGIPKGDFAGRTVGLLFPAKVFCGQSLLDSRRESIVLDYNFVDDLDGYLPQVDSLTGRNGLQLRDELRQVRPGFYLGRATLARVFVANLTLYSEAAARVGKLSEDCWTGERLGSLP